MTLQTPDPVKSIADIFKWIAILIFLIAIGYLIWDDNSLSKQVQDQRIEIEDYQTANNNLTTQVGLCNAAVVQLQKDSIRRQQMSENAVKAAQDLGTAAQQAVDKILKTVASSPDICAATKSFLSQYFGSTK